MNIKKIFVKYIWPVILFLLKNVKLKKHSITMEQLKMMVAFTTNFSESLINKLDDKKLSWTERFQLIYELKPILDILKNWRSIKQQIHELNEDKIKELVEFARLEFDINNDKAELIVKKALNLILAITELINSIK